MGITRNSIEDYLRVGAYAQMEGNFRFHPRGGYRFTFARNQIADMLELLQRVRPATAPSKKNPMYIQFYDKKLYEDLKDMGFYRFTSREWNIPKTIMLGESFKQVYLRAAIDSLGNVDIDKTVPYIRLQSVNDKSLGQLNDIFGGKIYSYPDTSYLQFKGREAISTLEYLHWNFYNHRNRRGSELIRGARWEKFI